MISAILDQRTRCFYSTVPKLISLKNNISFQYEYIKRGETIIYAKNSSEQSQNSSQGRYVSGQNLSPESSCPESSSPESSSPESSSPESRV